MAVGARTMDGGSCRALARALLAVSLALALGGVARGDEAPPRSGGLDVVVSVGDLPPKGDPNARLTLVEFSDYECPFCGRHARDTMPLIEQAYVKPGTLRYVFRDFPLASHRRAARAAEAARCAGEQGKYWEMHDRLFADQDGFGDDDLARRADSLGLRVAVFQQCLAAGRQASRVARDRLDGQRLGIRGTPTFLIGYTEPGGGSVRVVKVIVGAEVYSAFRDAIESVLAASR